VPFRREAQWARLQGDLDASLDNLWLDGTVQIEPFSDGPRRAQQVVHPRGRFARRSFRYSSSRRAAAFLAGLVAPQATDKKFARQQPCSSTG